MQNTDDSNQGQDDLSWLMPGANPAPGGVPLYLGGADPDNLNGLPVPAPGIAGPGVRNLVDAGPFDPNRVNGTDAAGQVNPPAALDVAGLPSAGLHPGDQSDDVRNLQRLLGIPDDGVYGPQTRHAVDLYDWANPLGDNLGALSRRYEAKDVSTVSSGTMGGGQPDPGGVSYGQFQLASKGTMKQFLASPEGAPYTQSFRDDATGQPLTPGTLGFTRRYLQMASADPQGFAKAQKDFLVRTHYQPVKDQAAALGFDAANRGVQEALFSQAVQTGRDGNTAILNNVIARYPDLANLPPDRQIRALYEARGDYVRPRVSYSAGDGRYATEMPEAVRISNYYRNFYGH